MSSSNIYIQLSSVYKERHAACNKEQLKIENKKLKSEPNNRQRSNATEKHTKQRERIRFIYFFFHICCFKKKSSFFVVVTTLQKKRHRSRHQHIVRTLISLHNSVFSHFRFFFLDFSFFFFF